MDTTPNSLRIRLNARQANYIAAFEAAYGRPATVTRTALLNIQTLWTGKTGPFGFTLRWPAWLTNSPTFTTERAVYALPWTEYDAFMLTVPGYVPPVAQPISAVPA